jgi:PKD repeat protein
VTWTQLTGPGGDALDRFSSSVIAAFKGRNTEATFSAAARFDINADSLTVDFTDQSSGGNGTVVAWLWDFGDGSTSTSQNPSHTYAAAGVYNIVLTVTTAAGLQASHLTTLTLVEQEAQNAAPVAAFTTVTNGLSVICTDGSTDVDGTIVDWDWDFGDTLPTAAFTSSVNGATVTFTDASSDVSPGTITARLWSFGDGSTSTETNPQHTYAQAGGYNVTLLVTDSDNNQASFSATVLVTQGATLGIPFGPFALSTNNIAPGVFSLDQSYTDASNILAKITDARTDGYKLRIPVAGGSHENYKTNGVFDRAKWNAQVLTLNTLTIRNAVAAAVADGTIVSLTIMDEPEHSSWGPSGTLTRAKLDSMVTFVKSIFTTAPVGVDHGAEAFYTWRTSETYQHVDNIVSNYVWRVESGNATEYRRKVLERAAVDHVAVCFCLNILDGGVKINGCVSGGCCPDYSASTASRTGGIGTFIGGAGQNCKMTAEQVRDWGRILGPAGCGLLMWQYQTAFMSVASNVTAFADVATSLATHPQKSWRRTT